MKKFNEMYKKIILENKFNLIVPIQKINFSDFIKILKKAKFFDKNNNLIYEMAGSIGNLTLLIDKINNAKNGKIFTSKIIKDNITKDEKIYDLIHSKSFNSKFQLFKINLNKKDEIIEIFKLFFNNYDERTFNEQIDKFYEKSKISKGVFLELITSTYIFILNEDEEYHYDEKTILHEFTHFIQLSSNNFLIEIKENIKDDIFQKFFQNNKIKDKFNIKYIFSENEFIPHINDFCFSINKLYYKHYKKYYKKYKFYKNFINELNKNLNNFNQLYTFLIKVKYFNIDSELNPILTYVFSKLYNYNFDIVNKILEDEFKNE